MNRIFLSILIIAYISFTPFISNADDVHSRGTIQGNVSFEIEGSSEPYTLSAAAHNVYLPPSGNLQGGRQMRCGPLPEIGKLKEAVTFTINITEKYTDSPEGRIPTGETGETEITFPAGSTLYGSCSGRRGSTADLVAAMSGAPPEAASKELNSFSLVRP